MFKIAFIAAVALSALSGEEMVPAADSWVRDVVGRRLVLNAEEYLAKLEAEMERGPGPYTMPYTGWPEVNVRWQEGNLPRRIQVVGARFVDEAQATRAVEQLTASYAIGPRRVADPSLGDQALAYVEELGDPSAYNSLIIRKSSVVIYLRSRSGSPAAAIFTELGRDLLSRTLAAMEAGDPSQAGPIRTAQEITGSAKAPDSTTTRTAAGGEKSGPLESQPPVPSRSWLPRAALVVLAILALAFVLRLIGRAHQSRGP